MHWVRANVQSLHDNDHKKMVRKIIQEQSKWKIYKKYIFQYISPASGYHVTCFLHLIFINQFSLTSLPATGVIWSSLVRYYFLLWKIPPFIESVAHGQIFLVLFLVQRLDIITLRRRGEELFCVPSSLSLMLLLLCTAPPRRAESPEFEKAVSLHTCSVLLCCFLNDFFLGFLSQFHWWANTCSWTSLSRFGCIYLYLGKNCFHFNCLAA